MRTVFLRTLKWVGLELDSYRCAVSALNVSAILRG